MILFLFSSTISSGINSLTAIVLEDVIKKIKNDIPDSKATFFSKIIGEYLVGTFLKGLFTWARLTGLARVT